jgi:hypothetical protein
MLGQRWRIANGRVRSAATARRTQAIAALAATALIGAVVTAGSLPASAHEASDDVASVVTVTLPDGSVETFAPEPDASFELPGQQPLASFSWEASYKKRIISREWNDTAGGVVSITTNAIRNCGGYEQWVYLIRELVDNNYVSVGEPRRLSCTNRTVNMWHDIPHTDRYAFLLRTVGGEDRTKTATGSVSY